MRQGFLRTYKALHLRKRMAAGMKYLPYNTYFIYTADTCMYSDVV